MALVSGFSHLVSSTLSQSVPKHRVAQVRAAVDEADGLLVVGSSLAVHSAFRHVRAASQKGIPIAVLNVGETRAETEGLDVIKLEAPAGPTLAGAATVLEAMSGSQRYAAYL